MLTTLQTNKQAWAKTLILFGLALYFAVIIWTGGLANYINARFAWLTVAAVPMLALLGIISLREAIKRPHPLPLSQGEGSKDHFSVSPSLWERGVGGEALPQGGASPRPYNQLSGSGAALTWPAVIALAIPLLLGLLVPSRPLGATAVNGDVSLSAINAVNASIFEADPLKWNVLDWLRAFHDSADITSFNGKQANLVAFVYREPKYPADTFLAARFTISCCVADASAIGLPVVWKGADAIPQDTWVQISGTFQVGDFGTDNVPILIADKLEQVPQPEHPYLYP